MKLTNMTASFLLMAAADFPLLRRSYETDQYDGQFPLDGCGGFSAAEALLRNLPSFLLMTGAATLLSHSYETDSVSSRWQEIFFS